MATCQTELVGRQNILVGLVRDATLYIIVDHKLIPQTIFWSRCDIPPWKRTLLSKAHLSRRILRYIHSVKTPPYPPRVPLFGATLRILHNVFAKLIIG